MPPYLRVVLLPRANYKMAQLRSYNIESNKRVRGCVATFKHLLAAARYGGNSDLQSADDHASGAVTDN